MKQLYILLVIVATAAAASAQNKFTHPHPAGQTTVKLSMPVEMIDASQTAVRGRAVSAISPAALLKKVAITKDTSANGFIFIENKAPFSAKNARRMAADVALEFIEEHKGVLRLRNPASELALKSEETDENRTHLRYQQHVGGVPVYGSEVLVHLKNNFVTSLNGRPIASPSLKTSPELSPEKAIELALKDAGKTTALQPNSFFKLGNEAELVVLPIGQDNRLAYHLTIRPNALERWIYFVDAQTGQVLDKYAHTCTLDGVFKTTATDLSGRTQEFKIYQKGTAYYMIDASLPMFDPNRSQMPDNPVGAIWTIDAQNSRIGSSNTMRFSHVANQDGRTWSPTAVSAHVNATTCYNYYATTHGRRSLNGAGGTIVSVINIADEDGTSMENAYWNGEFIGYGNGGQIFKPLAAALDVAGHEMTHGVIENTARLEYRNQSGALNESFADIFGTMIDRDDWTLGEDIVRPGAFPSGALRSLADPNQGGSSLNSRGFQPKNMGQYVNLPDTPDGDNGGVHINSGIPNHAYYLFATNAAVGKDKAERVFYQALTKYLTRTSGFLELRNAAIQSAKDLYGDGPVVAAAAAAFDAVGIGSSTGSTTENKNLPTNPGQESMVIYDPVKKTLYFGPYTNNSSFNPFAQQYGCLFKPSVTDDGRFVFFVGEDKHIYRKDLTTTAAPVRFSQDAVWRNVAVSKDGKRLAALTTDYDKLVYVFNIENPSNITAKSYKLYNPTYTTGVSTGEVKYAESMEWDYAGETIIYDAFNSVPATFSSQAYDFWDVGIIRAWNKSGNTFGTGVIEKLFTNLEKEESIGNPSYAKTNAGILAFDYVVFGPDAKSDTDDKFYIFALDVSKPAAQGLKQVIQNNTISHPDYSKSDQVMTFNSISSGKEVVRGVQMAADKITASGSPFVIFDEAKWAVWYAQGTRTTTPTKQAQQINVAAVPDQQPGSKVTLQASTSSNLPLTYTLKSGDATLNGNVLTLGNTPGKVVVTVAQAGNDAFNAASVDISFCIAPKAPVISLNGQNLAISGGQLYQWYLNGRELGGQTNLNSLPIVAAGSYTARTVTADGCLSQFSNAVSVQVLGLPELQDATLMLTPNPTTELVGLVVQPTLDIQQLDVYDAAGRWVKQLPASARNFSLAGEPSGLYILVVQTSTGIYQKRIVKN